MKTSRLFTIDIDIAERLKNLNASELVNRLLKGHFEVYSAKNTLLDEKKAVLSSISKKKRYFLKKLRLLMRGRPLVWTIFQRHGLRRALKYLRIMMFDHTWMEENLTSFLENSRERGK